VTRRDRAAMVYAAELLRGDCTDSAVRVLESEHIFGGALSEAASWVIEPRRASVYERRKRLLRARLALLLRALLRADAGDYGRLRCHCGNPVVTETSDKIGGGVHECFWCPRCREWRICGEWPRRTCRPLWERAPSHERGER
jgi:hypothetical protein